MQVNTGEQQVNIWLGFLEVKIQESGFLPFVHPFLPHYLSGTLIMELDKIR